MAEKTSYLGQPQNFFTQVEKGLFAKTDIPQVTRIGEYEGWLVTSRTIG